MLQLLLLPALVGPAAAQSPAVSNIRYELRFDAATAARQVAGLTMSFDAGGAGAVLLSLPTWTPGAYEVANFARHVREFSAVQAGRPVRWDKADFDTWRLQVPAPGPVTVRFEVFANDLDNARAWSRPDLLMVNGTNLFLWPEGLSHGTPATVTVQTSPGWTVATGMRTTTGGAFREANYHDLVDMPMFIGRLDVDSTRIEGVWYRTASWPAGAFPGQPREQFHRELQGTVPAMNRVFGEVPWDTYTTLLIFNPEFGGGSALEHQNSHVGIYHPQFIGSPILASITAHEIFHAWNVKRLRPADLWPYRYDQPQPTVWLWVSEGVTDYYADLALVRGKVVDSAGFLALIQEKIDAVYDAPVVALEDASLESWISPTDGSSGIYYPKGALAGMLLDILIRDASDNRQSLDDVMRTLYQRTWKQGRGFTDADWWGAVSEAAGGRSFAEFARRYIDGREEFPWAEVLPLAGLRLAVDSIREPRIGITTTEDSTGVRVEAVLEGSMGADAGVKPGDRLLQVGEIVVEGGQFGPLYRRRYATEREGLPITIVVERAGERVTLQGTLRMAVRVERRLEFAGQPTERAVRIRRRMVG